MPSLTHLTCSKHGTTDCAHVASAVSEDTARTDRRRVQLAAQAVLWRESRLKRVTHCGKTLAHGSDGVQLRVSESPHGGRRAGFAGLQSCGSVWACPVCSSKILAERQDEIDRAVTAWTGLGAARGQVAMAVFTVRHNRKQSAADVWGAVGAGWTGVTTGAEWQAEKARYGVLGPEKKITSCRSKVCGEASPAGDRHQSRCRLGTTTRAAVLPWLRVTEVTHRDKNGWHVHLHVVLFLPGDMTEAQLQDLYLSMWGRWDAAVQSAGYDGGLMVNQAKFMTGREVARDISKYVTKATYTDAAAATALEAARGDLKEARFGGRTPMQILRDVVLQPVVEQVAHDMRLWHEYEKASKGKRQMTWAVGSRDILGLGVERDDETIADDEVGSVEDAVVYMDAHAWYLLRTVAGRRHRVLDAAERSVDEALQLLDEWGVPYEGFGMFGGYMHVEDFD